MKYSSKFGMGNERSLLLQLGRELRESVHAGAALAALTLAAGCGGEEAVLPQETYALAQIGCFGPSHDSGYYGQCCFEAHCYTPEAGAACVGAEDLTALHSKIHVPGGSGGCGCSVPQEGHPDGIAGPFASNPADNTEGEAGREQRSGACCYVVGSIACTGRPFCVDGSQLVAEAVARVDWLVG